MKSWARFSINICPGTPWDATHFLIPTVALNICCDSENEPSRGKGTQDCPSAQIRLRITQTEILLTTYFNICLGSFFLIIQMKHLI